MPCETTFQPELISEKEAAKMLNISLRTLWTMRKAGEIPWVPLRRRACTSPRGLRDWVAAQQRSA